MLRTAMIMLVVAPQMAIRAVDVLQRRHSVIAADKGKLIRFDPSGSVVWEFSGIRQVHTLQ